MADKHVGINVPLFSLRSRNGWGVGELTDLEPFTAWLSAAGFDRLLLLPLGTMRHGETSPYSAASTLAIDPIYIGLDALADFDRAGGLAALSAGARAALDAARESTTIDYEAVRAAKSEALSLAFRQFLADDWHRDSDRARALAGYIDRERWWLDDYALYHAISESRAYASWAGWPSALRDREQAALADARRALAVPLLAHQYGQWIAEQQWTTAREAAQRSGVALYGDLPFVAGADSPEIWANAGDFMLDVSTGVPPDAFSATGQDWGLPTYRWDTIRNAGYAWLHHRARRMAALFDGLRVDHTIGLYRTYGRPADGEPFFTPADEPTQIAQGAEILRILGESGLDLIAEDLGSIPDFLRVSLAELGVPGCKVLRWERDWHAPGMPFIDPAAFPYQSAAMTGTHDTEPLSVWWREAPVEDRRALLELPLFRSASGVDPDMPWTAGLRDPFLELAYRAGSRELFLPVQDLFGWDDRINLPGTVGPHNWTWALPWPVDTVAALPETQERTRFLRGLSRSTGRSRPADGSGPQGLH